MTQVECGCDFSVVDVDRTSGGCDFISVVDVISVWWM